MLPSCIPVKPAAPSSLLSWRWDLSILCVVGERRWNSGCVRKHGSACGLEMRLPLCMCIMRLGSFR